jgi:hypothetical protein
MAKADSTYHRSPFLVACANFCAAEAVGDAADATKAPRKLVDLSCLDRPALTGIELRGKAAVARILLTDDEPRSPDAIWLVKVFPAEVESFLLSTHEALQ